MLGVAQAGELVAHADVSVGDHLFPLAYDVVAPVGFSLARVELGAGSATAQVYAVAAFSTYDGVDVYGQADAGFDPPIVAGDGRLSCLGAGVRRPVDFGRWRLVPHADFGVALRDTPMSVESYDDDVVAAYGAPLAGLHSAGPWVQGSVDFAVELVPDSITAHLSPDVAFVGIPGLWLAAGARAGFSAAF
jgi:hypothetical protein